jgi:hypothetical protein
MNPKGAFAGPLSLAPICALFVAGIRQKYAVLEKSTVGNSDKLSIPRQGQGLYEAPRVKSFLRPIGQLPFAEGVVRAVEQRKLSKQGGTYVQIGHAGGSRCVPPGQSRGNSHFGLGRQSRRLGRFCAINVWQRKPDALQIVRA